MSVSSVDKSTISVSPLFVIEAHSEKKGRPLWLVQERCRTTSSSMRDRLGALSTDDCLMRATVWSEHLLAVQLAEWIGDKLKARAVGVTKVQRVFAAFV